jgi:hypothetical protein
MPVPNEMTVSAEDSQIKPLPEGAYTAQIQDVVFLSWTAKLTLALMEVRLALEL